MVGENNTKYYINRATGETRSELPDGVDETTVLAVSGEEALNGEVNEDTAKEKKTLSENAGTTGEHCNGTDNVMYPTCEDLLTADMIIASVSTCEKVKRVDGKISGDSMKKAWQHYLLKRPVRDELSDVPIGFVLDQNQKVVLNENPNHPSMWKPLSTWRSICMVSKREFSDLGDGLSLTFQFMKRTSVFFLVMWLFGCVGWILQLVNPKDIMWVNVTFVWDIVFTVCFILYMINLRQGLIKQQRRVGEKNIMSRDYTIQISNLPSDVTAQEVHNYFSQFGNLHCELNNRKSAKVHVNHLFANANHFDSLGVTLIRDDANMIDIAYQLMEATEALRRVDADDKKLIADLTNRHQKLKSDYLELREKKYICVGLAFVTYESVVSKQKCLQAFQTLHARNANDGACDFLVPTKFRNNQNLTNKLKVKTAPEPSDILWKNLSTPPSEVLCRQLFVNILSCVYLFGVSLLMVYFATFTKANGIFGVGVLGVLGNILCCLTSIVILMPLASLLEKQHTRSKLEAVTFLKLAWFQWAGTIFATIYVFGLDEHSTAAFDVMSREQMALWGTGLPTLNCNISRFNNTQTSKPVFLEQNIAALSPSQCWAYTLDLYGGGISEFLIGNLLGDVAVINMLDYLCPVWWVETKILAPTAYYQKDLNKHYEGVDFKPFLRYQILLKFLLVGMTASCIDNPRILTLSVALCYYQCYGIEKFCFLLRYNKPPMFQTQMYEVAIRFGLPLALIIHLLMGQLLFGLTYEYHGLGKSGQIGDGKWNWYSNRLGIYGDVSLVVFVLGLLFTCVWFLPLQIWEFRKEASVAPIPITDDSTRKGHDLLYNRESIQIMQRNLNFRDALNAYEKKLEIGRVRRIERLKNISPTQNEESLVF